MIETLLENPFPAILIGGLMTAILAGGWLRPGRPALIVGMLIVLALTVTAVVVERLVETDREQITATLHEIARLVEQNDIDAAVEYAYSGAPQVRRHAEEELRRYEFSLVSIKRNLEIEVEPQEQPPRARATFNVVVIVSVRSHGLTDYHAPRFVDVTFYKEDYGQWRVGGYTHADPQRGWTVEDRWPKEQPQRPLDFQGKF